MLRQRDAALASDEKWWHKHARNAQITAWDGLSAPPHIPLWRRFGLPTLFTAAALGLCYAFSELYVPVAAGARLFPSIAPAAATTLGIIGANVLVWFAWRVPPLWRFLNANFLMHAVVPRSIQLLGCVFSHQKAMHLLANMAGVWIVGTRRECCPSPFAMARTSRGADSSPGLTGHLVCNEIGRGDFLALYVGAGVFSSWASLAYFLAFKKWHSSSLGASGAVAALMMCYAVLHEG